MTIAISVFLSVLITLTILYVGAMVYMKRLEKRTKKQFEDAMRMTQEVLKRQQEETTNVKTYDDNDNGGILQ